MSEVAQELAWVDTHCHIDAPEFKDILPEIISGAANTGVKAILLPTVQASDWGQAKNLVNQYGNQMPGLVYTLGIHPLYINQAQEGDIDILQKQIEQSLDDPRFVGVGEIGLDYFVEGLDPQRQEYFFHKQLDLAQQFQLPVILHVRRSQDAFLRRCVKERFPVVLRMLLMAAISKLSSSSSWVSNWVLAVLQPMIGHYRFVAS